MCRRTSEGGRRCPACSSSAGREAHNARRRANRAVRRGVADWAEDQGHPPELIEELRGAGIVAVKEWAREQGLDPAAFAEDTAGRERMVHGGDNPQTADARHRRLSERPWEGRDWATADLLQVVDELRIAQGDHPGERELLQTIVDSQEPAAEAGVNDTRRVEFDNGSAGYFKSFDGLDDETAEDYGQQGPLQPVHEAAAWQLAKQLGEPWSRLVPPCVIREVDGTLGSCAAERMGEPAYFGYDHTHPELAAAGFFDALIGQQDRHGGNFLVLDHGPGYVALIDHGFTFPAQEDDYRNAAALVDEREHTPLHPEERAALEKLLASPDLLGASRWLERDRAEGLRLRAEHMLAADEVLPEF